MANTPSPSHSKHNHRILVVEDDGNIRGYVSQALSRSGYDVDSAEDGQAAWETLERNCYDLMITDNHMPRVTGVELLKKMHAARIALPVIMATGTVPINEFDLYPWIQPTATLLKPYTAKELLLTVEQVLSKTLVTHPGGGAQMLL